MIYSGDSLFVNIYSGDSLFGCMSLHSIITDSESPEISNSESPEYINKTVSLWSILINDESLEYVTLQRLTSCLQRIILYSRDSLFVNIRCTGDR